MQYFDTDDGAQIKLLLLRMEQGCFRLSDTVPWDRLQSSRNENRKLDFMNRLRQLGNTYKVQEEFFSKIIHSSSIINLVNKLY